MFICRYVPSFIPPPLASKGKEPERKVSIVIEALTSGFIFNVEMYTDLMLVCCTFQKEEEKPKEKEKGKSRNIDHFMEELKQEQEMRERRNQDREQWRDGRLGEHSIVSDTFSYLLAYCL